MKTFLRLMLLSLCNCVLASSLLAQVPPSPDEIVAYSGLHAAAQVGDATAIENLISNGGNLKARDNYGRTPLHVAAYASSEDALEALAAAGSDMNALENDAYDIVTIAAVANDPAFLKAAIAHGASAGNITSPYEGTALIAAAHLGHHDVVEILIEAGAPLDHINNLGWTALIEAVILGDGGEDHIETVRLLLEAGADAKIADRSGATPLAHARRRSYPQMIELLERAQNTAQ